MKDHIIKDSILQYLHESGSIDVEQYCIEKKLDYDAISTHIDSLILNSLVDSRDITNRDTKRHNKSVMINHRGRFFLLEKGGFTMEFKNAKKVRFINTLKKALFVANSLLILVISAWGVYVAMQSNNNRTEEQILKDRIKQLEHQYDSVVNIKTPINIGKHAEK